MKVYAVVELPMFSDDAKHIISYHIHREKAEQAAQKAAAGALANRFADDRVEEFAVEEVNVED